MEGVVQDVATQVGGDSSYRLVMRDRSSMDALAQRIALDQAPIVPDRRLLLFMDAKGAEETGQSHHPSSVLAQSQQQIPVDRKAQVGVDLSAGGLPCPASPEHGLLGNEIEHRELLVVVGRHHPTADLTVVLV